MGCPVRVTDDRLKGVSSLERTEIFGSAENRSSNFGGRWADVVEEGKYVAPAPLRGLRCLESGSRRWRLITHHLSNDMDDEW